MHFILWTISAILMSISFQGSLGCSCLPNHPQDQFCGSDFVIRARAISRKIVQLVPEKFGKEAVYTVKILEAFKYDGSFKDFLAVQLYTPESSATCGVYLEIGAEYLITGTTVDGKRNIHSCALNSKWELLDSCIKDYLINDVYKTNCHCKINYCSGKECHYTKAPCLIDRFGPNIQWTSVCQSTRKGYLGTGCYWKGWVPCKRELPFIGLSTAKPVKRPTKGPFVL